jgi:putative oxidoreductase
MRIFLERLRPFAPLSLRLVLGAIFIVYGAHKLPAGAMTAFRTQIAAWHLPAWMAPAIGWGSTVGGALLVLGMLTRLAALALTAVVVIVSIKTKMHASYPDLEFPLLQLAGCISIVLSGAGRFSVDRKVVGGP